MSNLKCNELDDARGGQDDDRNARMHPSSRIQKRPRSHGTHNVSSSGNNSSTAAPALHTSAFVAAARCFILCSHVVQCSPGDATSCPQFHVHVQTQAHVVEPCPVSQQYTAALGVSRTCDVDHAPSFQPATPPGSRHVKSATCRRGFLYSAQNTVYTTRYDIQ